MSSAASFSISEPYGYSPPSSALPLPQSCPFSQPAGGGRWPPPAGVVLAIVAENSAGSDLLEASSWTLNGAPTGIRQAPQDLQVGPRGEAFGRGCRILRSVCWRMVAFVGSP